MQAYLKNVWEDVETNIKDSIEDPESRQILKDIIQKAMIKNKKQLDAEKPPAEEEEDDASKYKNKLDIGKGTTVSAYNLHWNSWKEKNSQKEWPDPEDDSKKMTAHKYWKDHIWPNISASEKKKWNEEANKRRTDIKKKGIVTKDKKRKVSKSGFQLFLEKQKTKMKKDEEFTNPETGNTQKLHHFLLYIWTNHIKDNDELKAPYEAMAKEMKDSEESDYNLDSLPYINPSKIRNCDLDNLELIESNVKAKVVKKTVKKEESDEEKEEDEEQENDEDEDADKDDK